MSAPEIYPKSKPQSQNTPNKSTVEQKSINMKTKFTRRNNKQQTKLIVLLSTLLLLVSLATGGYVIYQIQHLASLDKKEYKIKTKSLLSTIQKKQRSNDIATKMTVKQQNNLKYIFYTPDKSINAPYKKVKAALLNVKNKAEKQVTNKKAVVAAYTIRQHISDKLTKYVALADSYHWNDTKENFEPDKEITSAPIYVSETTGKSPDLNDLISDEEGLLSIQQVIQQKILDSAEDPEAIIDNVLSLPKISYTTPIDYSPDSLKVVLPENNLGMTEITLDNQEVAAFIDSSFIRPEIVKNTFPALDKRKKHIALTFDDGPNCTTTPQLLNILKAENVKATFFMLGNMVAENKEMAKKVYEEGHEIGSHTYSHLNLPTVSQDQVKKEIEDTNKVIFSATGFLPKNLRPPYGSINAQTAKTIGMPIIQWDIDSADWTTNNPEKIINSVEQNAFDGAIILLHDIHKQSITAAASIIRCLKNEGYEFVTIDQLLSGRQKPLHQYFGENDERLVN